MYKYKIGYHSYEESSYCELEHEKQFTREQIVDMIGDATVAVVKKMKEQPPDRYYLSSFQDVYSGIWCENEYSLMTAMIEMFGFKHITYENSVSVFGWGSIFHKGDWETERQAELNAITDKVRAAGFNESDDSHLDHQRELREKYEKEHPNEH